MSASFYFNHRKVGYAFYYLDQGNNRRFYYTEGGDVVSAEFV